MIQLLAIASAYRSVQANAATENAARNSMHCYAKAADLYVDGVSTRHLFNACWERAVSGTRPWWVGDSASRTFGPALENLEGKRTLTRKHNLLVS